MFAQLPAWLNMNHISSTDDHTASYFSISRAHNYVEVAQYMNWLNMSSLEDCHENMNDEITVILVFEKELY